MIGRHEAEAMAEQIKHLQIAARLDRDAARAGRAELDRLRGQNAALRLMVKQLRAKLPSHDDSDRVFDAQQWS